MRVRAVAKVFGVSGTVDSPIDRITNKDGGFDGEGMVRHGAFYGRADGGLRWFSP